MEKELFAFRFCCFVLRLGHQLFYLNVLHQNRIGFVGGYRYIHGGHLASAPPSYEQHYYFQ